MKETKPYQKEDGYKKDDNPKKRSKISEKGKQKKENEAKYTERRWVSYGRRRWRWTRQEAHYCRCVTLYPRPPLDLQAQHCCLMPHVYIYVTGAAVSQRVTTVKPHQFRFV